MTRSGKPPKAVCCRSRFQNIDGGYKICDYKNDGRPVYYSEEDKTYILFVDMGDEKRWIVSEQGKFDDDDEYSWLVASEETEVMSPDLCKAFDNGTHVEAIDVAAIKAYDDLHQPGEIMDKEFPPEMSSIGQPGSPCFPKVSVQWILATHLAGFNDQNKLKLFDHVEPSDIMQGALGDCWLMAGLAAIAEFPHYVHKNVIREREVSKNGLYHIRFWNVKKGAFDWIEIDEAIPCREKKWWQVAGRPLFAQPKNNELYILLIEKAFAKVGKSYCELSGGICSRAWMHLTGCEEQEQWVIEKRNNKLVACQSLLHIPTIKKNQCNFQSNPFGFTDSSPAHDIPTFWNYIRSCDEEQFIMGASIDSARGEVKRADGLVEGHAYSMISARVAVTNDGKKIHLIKLRNPWGGHEWNGNWSDSDKKNWKNVCVEQSEEGAVSDYNVSDGMFFMEWTEFMHIFTTISVSKAHMGVTRGSHADAKFEDVEAR